MHRNQICGVQSSRYQLSLKAPCLGKQILTLENFPRFETSVKPKTLLVHYFMQTTSSSFSESCRTMCRKNIVINIYFTTFRETSIAFQNKRNPYPESSFNHAGSMFCPVLFCSSWICSALVCSVLYCSVLVNIV